VTSALLKYSDQPSDPNMLHLAVVFTCWSKPIAISITISNMVLMRICS